MAELATAEVRLEVDFDSLDEDVKKGLETRVRRAAKVAQTEIDKTEVAAAALGQTIDKRVGGAADKAGAKLKRVSMTARVELNKATQAAGETADAVERLANVAGDTLFDIDDSGMIKLNQAVEDVQTSLFDLDTVELERVTRESDRAATSLGTRFVGAAVRARTALARVFLGGPGRSLATAAGDVENLGDRVADVGRRAEKSGGQLDRFSGRLGILISAISAAVAIAPAFITGGAAIGAFGALAVPTLINVIKAQTEMSDRWAGLTRDEKIAAAQTNALVDQFKALASELSPDTLRVYNGALANTAQLLPMIKPLAQTAADSLVEANQRIGEGLESDRARGFFDFLTAEAGPAIDQIVDVFLDFAAAGASLVQALAPLASVGLSTVSVILQLLTAVTDLSPELAQLVVVALALRSPLTAAGSAFGKFTAAAKGASISTRLLNLVTGAGPNLYVAAGTALAFFTIKALTAKTATDKLLASLRAQYGAIGNNILGFQAYASVLNEKLATSNARVAQSFAQFQKDATATNLELLKGTLAAEDFTRVPVSEEARKTAAQLANLNEAAGLLANKYGITTDEAVDLANAVGVNLSRGVVENGILVASAAGKFEAYAQAVRIANDPTAAITAAWERANNAALGLKVQVQALQEVYDAYLNPALAVLDAQNALTQAQQATAKELATGKVTQLERQELLSREITALRNRAQAEFAATKSTRETTAEILKRLPALQGLAGNTAEGTAAVRALTSSLGGTVTQTKNAITFVDRLGNRIRVLPDGRVEIRANTSPAESAVQRFIRNTDGRVVDIVVRVRGGLEAHAGATGGMLDPRRGFIRRARGGPSGRVRGPGTGTSDSIPALLSNGEYVVNAKQTRRYLGLLHALNAGRFAAGGLVGKVARFASGGKVGKARTTALVDLGALLGGDIRAGLRGSSKAIAAEVERIRKSLEKKIVAIGQVVGTGFVKSITGTPAEINRAFLSLEKKITKAFTGIRTRVDDVLVARLARQNAALSALAKRRDAIAEQLKDAAELATSVTGDARRFAAITGFDEDQASTAGNIAATLADRLTAIKTFQADVEALAKRGVDKTLIRQILDAGVEQGGELARRLSGASRTEIFEINRLQSRINATTKSLGRDSADLLYDAGAKAGAGFLAGLKAEEDEIIKLMTKIAKSVSATVRTTLKIKSPSRLLHADAVNTLRGYVEGLRATAGRVRSALVDAVQPTDAVRRAASLPFARAGRAGAGLTGADRVVRQTTIHAPITLISSDPTRAGDSVVDRLARLADATR